MESRVGNPGNRELNHEDRLVQPFRELTNDTGNLWRVLRAIYHAYHANDILAKSGRRPGHFSSARAAKQIGLVLLAT